MQYTFIVLPQLVVGSVHIYTDIHNCLLRSTMYTELYTNRFLYKYIPLH